MNAPFRLLVVLGCLGLLLVGLGCFVTACRSSQRQIGMAVSSPPQRPFIVADTATDSPGTNLETRVVTFTAEIGGTPPIFRQWKANRGGGFTAVSAWTTNSALVITNARVSDTGLYSLFATNAFGGTNTTPVRLVVVEGVD